MPEVPFPKPESGIEQALYIEKYNGPDKKQLLKRGIKQDIAVGLSIVPAGKAQHPGADIEYAEEQEQTQPLVGTGFTHIPFTKKQEGIDQAMHKKDQQQGAELVELEQHRGKIMNAIEYSFGCESNSAALRAGCKQRPGAKNKPVRLRRTGFSEHPL